MLYRFREAQAAELGLGTRGDRRPKMASACKSLRECERWRGEILREISRKVSKIQDCKIPSARRRKRCCFTSPPFHQAGLTDYEVRDLNDEINKLIREKRHWENQIVALGGANYRRNVAMLDDDGKEVPGTKGYKCVSISRQCQVILRGCRHDSQVFRPRQRLAGCQGALPESEEGGGGGEPGTCILPKVHESRSFVFWGPRRARRNIVGI